MKTTGTRAWVPLAALLMLLLTVLSAQAVMELPDFPVNDNGGLGHYYQFPPKAASMYGGSYLLVWADDRNGDRDIYAQRCDAVGNAIGPNVRINDDLAGRIQDSPAVGSSSTSNAGFVIAWLECFGPRYDLYARRYDASGTPIGGSFQVNDTDFIAQYVEPRVAMAPDGSFAVAWPHDAGSPNGDSYVRTYRSNGEPYGPSIVLDPGVAGTSKPDIAICGDAALVAAWHYFDGQHWGVAAQRFQIDGTPMGDRIVVRNPATWTVDHPAVAARVHGEFAVTWLDNENIAGALYDPSGQRLHSFLATSGHALEATPDIDMSTDGSFVVTWRDRREGEAQTAFYAHRFDADATQIGMEFRVTDPFGLVDPWAKPAAVAVAASGAFVITWMDYRDGSYTTQFNSQTYGRFYDAGGQPFGDGRAVNDDVSGAEQEGSDIAVSGDGSFVVAWWDSRDGNAQHHGGIYAQRFLSNGSPVGPNFRVSGPEAYASTAPKIDVGGTGRFVVTWTSSGAIFGQRYDASGDPIGGNFYVQDGYSLNWISPAIGVAADGSFVIAWSSDVNGELSIYFQRFDPEGNPIGTPIAANETPAGQYFYPPYEPRCDVAVGDDGTFVITWDRSGRRGNPPCDIMAQLFGPDGTPIGSNFIVSDATFAMDFPDVVFSANGSFAVAWLDMRDPEGDIYVQLYNGEAYPLRGNIRVNETSVGSSEFRYGPSIALNPNGAAIVSWTDPRNAECYSDVYAQMVLPDGGLDGSNFRLTQSYAKGQLLPSLAANGNQIYASWTDSRIEGHGHDICARLLDWPSTASADPGQSLGSRPGPLRANVPNPFHTMTDIVFDLASPGDVRLTLYDVSGRLVRSLLTGQYVAGVHRLAWDGTDTHGAQVRPGIYYCRMQANGFTSSRRLVRLD